MSERTLEQLAARVDELERRQAVADVYAHYAWLLDSRQWVLAADEIFAEDAELSLGTGMATSKGRAAIRASFDSMLPDLEGTAHYFTNIMVTIEPDGTANGRAYFQSYHWAMETADAGTRRAIDFVGSGVYLDRLREYPEGWRIFDRKRRNLGPSPLALGALPPGFAKRMTGWGGSREA